ncbi:YheT family hydrolase [Desulfomicrobium salsuginis]
MVRLRTAFPFSSGHVQTLFPHVFRVRARVPYERQRLETSDGDFVDLDWSRTGSDRLTLVLHGLEGHSRSKYVLGMARAARHHGLDVLAMNHRSCGGELNRKPTMYHSGWTRDLHEVLLMVESLGRYRSVDLVGFSLGANVVLKYLGEDPAQVPGIVRRAVALSVPCDLEDAAGALERPECAIYMRYLLDLLRKKIIRKSRVFPGVFDLTDMHRLRTFRQFDDRFTAPMHGFRDALDYWRRSSSRQFLGNIEHRTCLINAANDPFLGPRCFPVDEVRASQTVSMVMPQTGGHVGFVGSGSPGWMYWSEWMAMRFVQYPDCPDVQNCVVR